MRFGPINKSPTTAWATPNMRGMPYVLLQPASGAEVYLRFIETGNAGGYWPPVTQGWIATEVLTTDPDALPGQRIWPQEPFRIGQMSRVLGLPAETAYPISLARIPGRSFLLELEELPNYIERRAVPAGQLPEGLAMVSFTSAPLSERKLDYRAEARRIDLPPYNGRQVAVIEGPAGEWLELID